MSSSRPLLAVPALIAASLFVAGCTGPGSSDASPSTDVTSSPLGQYLDAVYGTGGSPEQQQTRQAEEQKKREELVASCMKEKGFEYTPDLQTGTISLMGDDVWKPDDREWVSQWGYGAVDFPGRDESVNPTDTWVDPNADYLASLSDSETSAFYEALWGTDPTGTSADDSAGEGSDEALEWNWQTAGCQGAAQHEVTGEDPLQSDEFAPLMTAMSELWQESSTSPQMQDADREWASCMDEAGHPGFSAQSDAAQSIHTEVSGLWSTEGASTDEPIEPDPAALAEVKKEEITLALADLDCREKTDYTARAEKVRWEAEASFVADHKAELEALKAAAAQARS